MDSHADGPAGRGDLPQRALVLRRRCAPNLTRPLAGPIARRRRGGRGWQGARRVQDQVARCIVREIKEGRGSPHGGVFLDIAWIKDRLPNGAEHIKKKLAGIDITAEPMEVGPTTHYVMGGIRVDPDSQMSTVPGLFAAGECAAGLHGANRLGVRGLHDRGVRRDGRAGRGASDPGGERERHGGSLELQGREVRILLGGGQRQSQADVYDPAQFAAAGQAGDDRADAGVPADSRSGD